MASYEVFIRNIPWERNAADLVQLIQSFLGENSVVSCKIAYKESGFMQKQSKGFAFVEITDMDSAERLCELSRQKLLVLQGRAGARHLEVKMKAAKAVRAPTHGTAKMEGGTMHMLVPTGKTVAESMWKSPPGAVELQVCFDTRKVTLLVKASTGHSTGEVHRKLEFKFRNLQSVERGDGNSVVLESNQPPRLYRTINSPGSAAAGLSLIEQLLTTISLSDPFSYRREEADELIWSRAIDFTSYGSVGRCMLYVLSFPQAATGEQQRAEREMWGKLTQFHLTKSARSVRDIAIQGSVLKDHLDGVARLHGVQRIRTLTDAPADVANIPFEVLFQINKLVQHGFIGEASIDTRFYALLQRMTPEKALHAVQAMHTRHAISYDAVELLKTSVRKSRRWPSRENMSGEYMLVFTLVVTPTAAYCQGPEILLSNRITRKFHNLQDHFLAVSFVDEGGEQLGSYALTYGQKLFMGMKETNNEVYDHFLSILKDGINLCGRHYDFLGFSNSQLRNTHFWMFAAKGHITAEYIRRWTGNYDNIKNVGKSAARRGQCYSSSRSTLEVHSYEIEKQDDIVRTNWETGITYNFSDGIGQMSPAFASQVASAILSLADEGIQPSAFQVRYAGYKGVVATNVHRPDLWRRHKLLLRKSMLKFESTHTNFEVLDWSRFRPFHLNRQVIILLSTLNIPDRVFEHFQNEMAHKLDLMVGNSAEALDVLRTTCSGDAHNIVVEMLLAGFHVSSEPFLKAVLQSFRALRLAELRTKARIFVPRGRCLMGCLDEIGLLQYGQVFIQVTPCPGTSAILPDTSIRGFREGVSDTSTGGQRARVVTGKVVVTKNPCLHPGDILVLEAVDKPELHHLVDCVVFPQNGKRPHPNECSGSDLDGDLYFVTWDPRLVPDTLHPPMDYEPGEAKELDRPVSIEDIQKFFMDAAVSNSLGQICNAHLAHADQSPLLARDAKCLKLATLASIAVDFPKTGQPAVMSPDLRAHEFPDFMEKTDKTSVKSKSVIGKLYWSIKESAEEAEKLLGLVVSGTSFWGLYDGELRVDGFQDYLDEAKESLDWYDNKLWMLMSQYEIQTEAEAVTGNVLHLSQRFQRKVGEARDRIRAQMSAIRKEVQHWFWAEFAENGDAAQKASRARRRGSALFATRGASDFTREEKAKASAWYFATYDAGCLQARYEGYGGAAPFLSFPWVACDAVLAAIKAEAGGPRPSLS